MILPLNVLLIDSFVVVGNPGRTADPATRFIA
jgi:hypothetical protein